MSLNLNINSSIKQKSLGVGKSVILSKPGNFAILTKSGEKIKTKQ